jgi:mono/diheme cytochrome c family protein
MKPGGGYLAPALDVSGHMHHHAPDVLMSYLKNGSPAEDSSMRSFQDRMSDQDMRAVLAYLWSLWPEELQSVYERAHRQH